MKHTSALKPKFERVKKVGWHVTCPRCKHEWDSYTTNRSVNCSVCHTEVTLIPLRRPNLGDPSIMAVCQNQKCGYSWFTRSLNKTVYCPTCQSIAKRDPELESDDE